MTQYILHLVPRSTNNWSVQWRSIFYTECITRPITDQYNTQYILHLVPRSTNIWPVQWRSIFYTECLARPKSGQYNDAVYFTLSASLDQYLVSTMTQYILHLVPCSTNIWSVQWRSIFYTECLARPETGQYNDAVYFTPSASLDK